MLPLSNVSRSFDFCHQISFVWWKYDGRISTLIIPYLVGMRGWNLLSGYEGDGEDIVMLTITKQLWFMVARDGWSILKPPWPGPPSKAQAFVRIIEMYLRWQWWWSSKKICSTQLSSSVCTWKAAPGSSYQFSGPEPLSPHQLHTPEHASFAIIQVIILVNAIKLIQADLPFLWGELVHMVWEQVHSSDFSRVAEKKADLASSILSY